MSADASTLPDGPMNLRLRRISPGLALRHALLVARRNLLQVRGNPQLLIFLVIQPILFVLLFVYVFGGAIAGSSRQYVQFVIPGIIVQTVVFATAVTGIGLNEDLAKGIIDRFRSLPIARSAVLAGRILADAVRLTATVLVILTVGIVLGFRITTSPLAALAGFVLIIAFGMALSWVAALIGLSVRNPETAQSAGFIWMFPLTFASSAFVVASTMPGWLQPFVRINPISVAADALRGLLLAGLVLTPVLKTVAWIVALTVVFAPLAIRQYRRLADPATHFRDTGCCPSACCSWWWGHVSRPPAPHHPSHPPRGGVPSAAAHRGGPAAALSAPDQWHRLAGGRAGLWQLVASLRTARIAHHDLALASVMVDKQGEVWLVDFDDARRRRPPPPAARGS